MRRAPGTASGGASAKSAPLKVKRVAKPHLSGCRPTRPLRTLDSQPLGPQILSSHTRQLLGPRVAQRVTWKGLPLRQEGEENIYHHASSRVLPSLWGHWASVFLLISGPFSHFPCSLAVDLFKGVSAWGSNEEQPGLFLSADGRPCQ